MELRKKSSFFCEEKPFLSLSNKDIEKGYEIIKEYGIGKKDKWICVYNRDEAFFKKFSKKARNGHIIIIEISQLMTLKRQ